VFKCSSVLATMSYMCAPTAPPGKWFSTRCRSRTRTPPKNLLITVQSLPSLASGSHSRILRQTRLLKQRDARSRDEQELFRLRAQVAELELRPQYVTVETVVEKVVEVEVANDSGQMNSDEKLLEFMESALKPFQESNAEYVSTIAKLESHVESLTEMNQDLQSMVGFLNSELGKVKKVDGNDLLNSLTGEDMQDMQFENESLKMSLATAAEAHMKVEVELAGYRSNLAEWMDDCLDRYRGALFNLVPLPSRDHVIVVALKSAPHLNGTAVRVVAWHEDRDRWQVLTAQGKTLLLKSINILREDVEDEIDAAMFQEGSDVRLEEIDVDDVT